MARYVAVYIRDKPNIDDYYINIAQPEHVVIDRSDVRAYYADQEVLLAQRCPGPLHARNQISLEQARGCPVCRGWGLRPLPKDKATAVEMHILGTILTSDCPQIDDWREREGSQPRWLVEMRAKKDAERTRRDKEWGRTVTGRTSVATTRPGRGPRYRPRK